jgi:hypothetical protein
MRVQAPPRDAVAARGARSAAGRVGGESFMRVHWVAVPKAFRARRVNRCCSGARSPPRARGRAGRSIGGWWLLRAIRLCSLPGRPGCRRDWELPARCACSGHEALTEESRPAVGLLIASCWSIRTTGVGYARPLGEPTPTSPLPPQNAQFGGVTETAARTAVNSVVSPL